MVRNIILVYPHHAERLAEVYLTIRCFGVPFCFAELYMRALSCSTNASYFVFGHVHGGGFAKSQSVAASLKENFQLV